MDINKIKEAFKGKKIASVKPDEVIKRVYHILMKTYGYIPYNEFIDSSVFLTLDLLSEIHKDNEAEKKAIEDAKRKGGKRWR